jgi:hypothetical protein
MLKRVNTGPSDDPDEYWFECDDCEGTGWVNFPAMPQEPHVDEHGNEEYEFWTQGTCPGCDGLGFWEGEADD